MELKRGETWYGKVGTAYQYVSATISNITVKYVQLTFEHPVHIETAVLGGTVLGKRTFSQLFEPFKQISLFDLLEE